MLQSLLIENFQRHQKIEVALDPLVTTFCGKTNSGKSSFLRALRWVCTNQPRGDDFVRHGSSQAIAALKVDGHIVKRVRGGGKNEYGLDDKSFVSFNNDVPEPIAALLNVEAVNFQRQLDAPFWLSLTPGEVSRELNAVVDLSVIDSSLSAAASQVKSAKSELEFTSKRLEQAREQRDALQFVHQLNTDLQRLEELDSKLSHERLALRRTSELLRKGREIERELQILSTGILTQGKTISNLEYLARKIEEEKLKYSSIQKLLKEGGKLELELEIARKEEARIKKELRDLSKSRCLECGRPFSEGGLLDND